MLDDTIERGETSVIRVPLKSPFRTGGGTYEFFDKVVVRLETRGGVAGFGEAVPFPQLAPESIGSIKSALDEFLIPVAIGRQPWHIAQLHHEWEAALQDNPYAKAAIDMAAIDCGGQCLNVPAHDLLGGSFRSKIRLAQSMGAFNVEESQKRAKQILAEGYAVVKLKVGMDVAEDVERVLAVRAAVGPDALLRVDANQGYGDATTAIDAVERMDVARLYLVEQPVHRLDIDGMSRVRDAIRPPLLADESLHTVADGLRLRDAGAADVWNIKVQKAGGLYPATILARLADAARIPVLVGSQMETGIGTAASAHLAATITTLNHPSDIKTPTAFVSDVLTEPIVIAEGYTQVPRGPGLGITVDRAKLEELQIA